MPKQLPACSMPVTHAIIVSVIAAVTGRQQAEQ
jgi:hypothetical protein